MFVLILDYIRGYPESLLTNDSPHHCGRHAYGRETNEDDRALAVPHKMDSRAELASKRGMSGPQTVSMDRRRLLAFGLICSLPCAVCRVHGAVCTMIKALLPLPFSSSLSVLGADWTKRLLQLLHAWTLCGDTDIREIDRGRIYSHVRGSAFFFLLFLFSHRHLTTSSTPFLIHSLFTISHTSLLHCPITHQGKSKKCLLLSGSPRTRERLSRP